jgi:hypothetical protein
VVLRDLLEVAPRRAAVLREARRTQAAVLREARRTQADREADHRVHRVEVRKRAAVHPIAARPVVDRKGSRASRAGDLEEVHRVHQEAAPQAVPNPEVEGALRAVLHRVRLAGDTDRVQGALRRKRAAARRTMRRTCSWADSRCRSAGRGPYDDLQDLQ